MGDLGPPRRGLRHFLDVPKGMMKDFQCTEIWEYMCHVGPSEICRFAEDECLNIWSEMFVGFKESFDMHPCENI